MNSHNNKLVNLIVYIFLLIIDLKNNNNKFKEEHIITIINFIIIEKT